MKSINRSLAGILAITLSAGTAAAQQAPAATPAAADQAKPLAADEASPADIVVTAQRRDQALQDVPIAIQAFSGDSLVREGVKSAADVLDLVPSASFQSRTPTQTVLQMRGISQNAAVDPSVAFYVDEVPLGFPGQPYIPNVDTLDLTRIEVLRGPQGTLYGLGAMGGTVRTITADPSFSEGFHGKVIGEGATTKGGNGSYGVSGAVNVPIVDDLLAARFVVSYRKIGGWIDDIGRGTTNINDSKAFSFRGKLLFTPTPDLSIKLTYWHNEADTKWSNQASFKNTTQIAGTGNAGDPEAFQNSHFDIVSGFASYDLGFATIENGLSYYKSNIPARYAIGFPSPPAGPGLLKLDVLDEAKALTNEFRIVSAGKTQFQWIAGVFYRDSSRRFVNIGGFAFLPLPSTDGTTTSKSVSIFGEASYGTADDRLRLLVGGRYFHDDRRFLETSILPGATTSYVSADFHPKFNSFNPRINLTFKPTDDLMLYSNIAKGFRSGIINNGSQVAAAAASGLTGIAVVQPDSIWSYEVGGKVTLFDKKVILDTALFYSDWKDFQFAGATSNGFQFSTNGGDARIKGIEGSITWRTPLRGLTIAAAGSYNDAKFRTVNALIRNASPLFVPGARLPQQPEYSGSVNVSYDTPIGGQGVHFVAGGVYTFRGDQIDSTGRPDAVTGFTIRSDPREELALRVGVRKDEWEITAFANNVTNNLESVSSQAGTWFTPTPRTIGVRLTAPF